jgi:hypothetical protein
MRVSSETANAVEPRWKIYSQLAELAKLVTFGPELFRQSMVKCLHHPSVGVRFACGKPVKQARC